MIPYNKPKELESFRIVKPIPVQWGDQDAFGHVNNTVPIRWFESARIGYFEESGMNSLFRQFKIGPILASITCHFRRQIHYPDLVLVGAQITRIGRTSMTMSHAVYSTELKSIVADGDSVIVAFDYATNKPEPINEEIRRAIDQTEGRRLEA